MTAPPAIAQGFSSGGTSAWDSLAASVHQPSAASIGGAANTSANGSNDSAGGTTRDDLVNLLSSYEGGSGEMSKQMGLENQLGVNSLRAAMDQANQYAAIRSDYYDTQIENIRANVTGMGQQAVDQRVNILSQQKSTELAHIAISQAVATDDYTRVEELVVKLATAQTQDQQNKIDAIKDRINAIDTDPKTKAEATAKANELQATLEEKKTAIADINKNLAQNNAPQSVKDAVSEAAQDPTKTATDLYSIAGTFAVDQEKAALTYKTKLEADKIKSDIAAAGPGGSGAMSDSSVNFWAQAGASGVNMNGLLPSVGMGTAAVQIKTKLLNQMAENASTLGIDGHTFASMISDSKAKQAAMKQLQVQGSQTVVNEQSASKYFDTLSGLASKVDESVWATGAPILDNWIKTGTLETTGNADVNNFTTQMTEALTEYAKVMSGQTTGAGVTQYAAEIAKGLLDKGFNASTIKSFIKVAKGNMSDRITSFDSALQGLFGNIETIQNSSGGLGTGVGTSESITKQNTSVDKTSNTVNLPNGQVMTFPTNDAFNKFLTDHGL